MGIVLQRSVGQSLIVGLAEVKVRELRGAQAVALEVTAPRCVGVHRKEVGGPSEGDAGHVRLLGKIENIVGPLTDGQRRLIAAAIKEFAGA